jgi:hypothetical protein
MTMPRRTDPWRETENLCVDLYRRDLHQWSDWLRQQDRLLALIPRAIDVLEQEFEAGGPEAVKLVLALVKLADVAGPVEKPHMELLGFAEADELRARLAAHATDDDDVSMLPSGE